MIAAHSFADLLLSLALLSLHEGFEAVGVEDEEPDPQPQSFSRALNSFLSASCLSSAFLINSLSSDFLGSEAAFCSSYFFALSSSSSAFFLAASASSSAFFLASAASSFAFFESSSSCLAFFLAFSASSFDFFLTSYS